MSTWHSPPSPRESQVLVSSSSSTSSHHGPLPEPELESTSSLSSIPSSSSSSSSSNPSSFQPVKYPRTHVHFSPILKTASVVNLKSKLSSSSNDSQQKGEEDNIHTKHYSTLNDYIDELLEVDSKSNGDEQECKKGRRKEKAVENEKDELLAKTTKLISRLHTSLLAPNKQGAEPTTTDLKIRIAILKNEVKHAKRDKEAVEKSLGILIESMARVCFSSPSTNSCNCSSPTKVPSPQPQDEERKLQESELESLKRENRNLRAKNRELDNRLRYREKNKNEDDEFESENDSEVADVTNKKKWKGKEKEISTPTALAGSWGVIDATDSDFPLTSNQEHADVGLHSLEDLLGNEDDDSVPSSSTTLTSLSTSTSIFSSQGPKDAQLQETNLGRVREQLVALDASTPSLTTALKPNVLKVGFSNLGGVRGFEYSSSEENIGRPPTYPRIGSMRTYDRFAATKNPSPRLGVFDNSDERNGALSAHACLANNHPRGLGGGREKSFPEFFRYGIQYRPGENESGFLRTVHISPLPYGVTLRDVLARIRGGDVLSAVLVDTMNIVGGMSVRLVFKQEAAAKIFVSFVANDGIYFCNNESNGEKEYRDNLREKSIKADVTLISTPTFPLPVSKFHHLTYTRCLRISHFRSFPHTSITHTIAHLQRLLTNPYYSAMRYLDVSSFYHKEALLELWLDEASTLHLHFSSVENAGWAWDVLSREGWKVECEDDPCAGDVAELLEPPTPRRPLIPEGFELGEEGMVDSHSRIDAAMNENEKMENKVEVLIPSFSGAGIKGKNWADEVEEEEIDLMPNTNLNPLSPSAPHQASDLSSGSISQSHSYPISNLNSATLQDQAPNTKNTINNQEHAPLPPPPSTLDLESKAPSQLIDTSPSVQTSMVNTNPNTAVNLFPISPTSVHPGDNILELLTGSDDDDDESRDGLVEIAQDAEATSKPGLSFDSKSSANVKMDAATTTGQDAYSMLGSWAGVNARGESKTSGKEEGKGRETQVAVSAVVPVVVINPEEIDLDFGLE